MYAAGMTRTFSALAASTQSFGKKLTVTHTVEPPVLQNGPISSKFLIATPILPGKKLKSIQVLESNATPSRPSTTLVGVAPIVASCIVQVLWHPPGRVDSTVGKPVGELVGLLVGELVGTLVGALVG